MYNNPESDYDLLGQIDVIRSVGPIYSIEMRCDKGRVTELISMSKILLFDDKTEVYDEFTESLDEKTIHDYSSFERSQEYWIQFTNSYKQPLSKCELLSLTLRGTGGLFTLSGEIDLEDNFYIDSDAKPTYFVKTRQIGTIDGIQLIANDLTAPWYLEQIAIERLVRSGMNAERWEDRQVFKLDDIITPEQGTRGVLLGTSKPQPKPQKTFNTVKTTDIQPKKLSRSVSRASSTIAYRSAANKSYAHTSRVNFDTMSMISYGSTVINGGIENEELVTYNLRVVTETAKNFDPKKVQARVYGENGSTKRLKLARNKNSSMFNDYTIEDFYSKGRPVGAINGVRLYFKNQAENSQWKINQLKVSDQESEMNDWRASNILLTNDDLSKDSVDVGSVSGVNLLLGNDTTLNESRATTRVSNRPTSVNSLLINDIEG